MTVPKEEITARRDAMGMTQVQLAADLGVDQSTVSSWETGRHTIPRHHWDRMNRHQTPMGAMGPDAVTNLYMYGPEDSAPNAQARLELAGFNVVCDMTEAHGIAMLPGYETIPKKDRAKEIAKLIKTNMNVYVMPSAYWLDIGEIKQRKSKRK